eukprot:1514698-Rhodomonas_salina.3
MQTRPLREDEQPAGTAEQRERERASSAKSKRAGSSSAGKTRTRTPGAEEAGMDPRMDDDDDEEEVFVLPGQEFVTMELGSGSDLLSSGEATPKNPFDDASDGGRGGNDEHMLLLPSSSGGSQGGRKKAVRGNSGAVSYTHLRAHETEADL